MTEFCSYTKQCEDTETESPWHLAAKPSLSHATDPVQNNLETHVTSELAGCLLYCPNAQPNQQNPKPLHTFVASWTNPCYRTLPGTSIS